MRTSTEDWKRAPGAWNLPPRPTWRQRLARWRGTSVNTDLSAFIPSLARINALEERFEKLERQHLLACAREIGSRGTAALESEEIRCELYACLRECSRRLLGLRPHDVQLLAALAMDAGAVVEMQTGEGKTLAAVLTAARRALARRGMHLLTFNDYLARRDASWMSPLYDALGLSIGAVEHGMSAGERKRAYAADVTYVTAREAGFDQLRDALALEPGELVHRPLHAALVDEADSLLVDEARVPLVIAGSTRHDGIAAGRLARLVATLEPGVHYDTDEYAHEVELTEHGIERAEAALGCGPLHQEANLALLAALHCALHARALLRRDVDYIVREGRIGVVDEFTGRVVADRHWPDGLQGAIEAKEGLARDSDGRILGTTTLQHYLHGYEHLSGMTGTAQSAATELDVFYGLPVVVIPTHRPAIRIDHADAIYATRSAKEDAVFADVQDTYRRGRPILVGTLTVEESERLAARLTAAGVPCQVLNARHDADEARVIAQAGRPGAVTISTNMAGRGTDIRLGGADGTEHGRVAGLGGLYVIGTGRHASSRVDLQLRGRAGRQGDPGESRFFVSLEDDLLVQYGIDGLIGGRFVPAGATGPIDHPVVVTEVARAQRMVESHDFELRRTLWQYAVPVEAQRQQIMSRRQALLNGESTLELPLEWHTRRAAFTAAGEGSVADAERCIALQAIDGAWSDHLAFVADLREGVHLVALGGQDPLTRFTSQVITAFDALEEEIERRVATAL